MAWPELLGGTADARDEDADEEMRDGEATLPVERVEETMTVVGGVLGVSASTMTITFIALTQRRQMQMKSAPKRRRWRCDQPSNQSIYLQYRGVRRHYDLITCACNSLIWSLTLRIPLSYRVLLSGSS